MLKYFGVVVRLSHNGLEVAALHFLSGERLRACILQSSSKGRGLKMLPGKDANVEAHVVRSSHSLQGLALSATGLRWERACVRLPRIPPLLTRALALPERRTFRPVLPQRRLPPARPLWPPQLEARGHLGAAPA